MFHVKQFSRRLKCQTPNQTNPQGLNPSGQTRSNESGTRSNRITPHVVCINPRASGSGYRRARNWTPAGAVSFKLAAIFTAARELASLYVMPPPCPRGARLSRRRAFELSSRGDHRTPPRGVRSFLQCLRSSLIPFVCVSVTPIYARRASRSRKKVYAIGIFFLAIRLRLA